MPVVAGAIMYSCSGDALYDEGAIIPPAGTDPDNHISLSISMNAPGQSGLKSSGNEDGTTDSKIYSLEVLIFRSSGEANAGNLDGYKSVPRTEILHGTKVYRIFKEIDEIKSIRLTAGKRDVYVIANAPDDYFSSVTTLSQFLSIYEELPKQIHYPNWGTIDEPEEELPIAGIDPEDLRTNLTMCNYLRNVEFSNAHEQHYLGYTTNNGRPTDVLPDYGYALDGLDAFYVERLVARVALKKIEFELPATLYFEKVAGVPQPCNYFTAYIDTVYMLNVRLTSKYVYDLPAGFTHLYGHGSYPGYAFLNDPGYLANLSQSSIYAGYLSEYISTNDYDINDNATPLWFYTFENEEGVNPTYIVIEVRYNFRSSIDGVLKTVKCYYPVVVNAPKSGKTVDHDYIKRNYQYQVNVKIKGLGSMYGFNAGPLRSAQDIDGDMEITERVGHNLFPWNGNTYKELSDE